MSSSSSSSSSTSSSFATGGVFLFLFGMTATGASGISSFGSSCAISGGIIFSGGITFSGDWSSSRDTSVLSSSEWCCGGPPGYASATECATCGSSVSSSKFN